MLTYFWQAVASGYQVLMLKPDDKWEMVSSQLLLVYGKLARSESNINGKSEADVRLSDLTSLFIFDLLLGHL